MRKSSSVRFAEREVHGVDDAGEPERIVIWIERLPGALWAVGRAVNPQYRPTDEARHRSGPKGAKVLVIWAPGGEIERVAGSWNKQ